MASGGNELIKIRHSQVTDNYLAAEEIPNQDWQFFIERILEVSNAPNAIQLGEIFLMTTIENVTIAKRIYKMLFDTVANNFNLTIQDLSQDKIKNISEDFFLKNSSYSESITNLHDWISYYYLFGRFPGSKDFINVPYHKKPYFIKTEKSLSPANLYKKFSSSDTLVGLVSFHALCALNIYLGGNKNTSAVAYGEFLKNMTYQALSEENDSVFLFFDEGINLVHSIVNTLVDITREENDSVSEISDKINKKLDFTFNAKEEATAMSVQLGTETPIKLSEPVQSSTPLTEAEIKSLYDQEKTDYLKRSLQINSIDLESAAERADIENEKLFQEIINPTPNLIIDDKIDVDTQFDFKEDSNQDFKFSDALKARLNETIEKARKKINSVSFTSPAIEEIPNNTYPKQEITTEDIYIDDSLQDLVKPIYFPQPSTDFKIDIEKNEMILFKSPSLTVVNIYKEDLHNILQKIIDDLDLNLKDMLMSPSDTQDTKQKKVILNQLIKRLNKSPKKDIEKQLESQRWLQNLIDDQLKTNNSFSFGKYDYESNKFKNVTKRKKGHSPMYLQYLEAPSIYSLIPTSKLAKIESGKNIFSNIIKNIPPENYKKFKTEYDPSNDITVDEFSDDEL